jgi:fructokinase
LTTAALADADSATLLQALRHAVASASLNAMREGCNPATSAEVAAYLALQAH